MVSMALVQRQVQNTTVQMSRDRQLGEQLGERFAYCIGNVSSSARKFRDVSKKLIH